MRMLSPARRLAAMSSPCWCQAATPEANRSRTAVRGLGHADAQLRSLQLLPWAPAHMHGARRWLRALFQLEECPAAMPPFTRAGSSLPIEDTQCHAHPSTCQRKNLRVVLSMCTLCFCMHPPSSQKLHTVCMPNCNLPQYQVSTLCHDTPKP